MDELLTFSIPKSESYFAIPDDLDSLENMTVLDYLRQHVWLSYEREKRCREIFYQLLQGKLSLTNIPLNYMANSEDSIQNEESMPVAFLGTALINLLHVSISEEIVDELLQALDYENLQFQSLSFCEWCGISAFAERMLFAGPFKCSTLEHADFKFLKEHGEWYDISPALRKVFEIVEYTHKMPVVSMEE